MKTFDTIIKAIVTEKSSRAQEKGKYTFLIKRTATKIDVKNAIKVLYGADVVEVRTIIAPKKTRILKGKYVWDKRPVMKKAIVKLKDKQTIDPNKFKESKK